MMCSTNISQVLCSSSMFGATEYVARISLKLCVLPQCLVQAFCVLPQCLEPWTALYMELQDLKLLDDGLDEP